LFPKLLDAGRKEKVSKDSGKQINEWADFPERESDSWKSRRKNRENKQFRKSLSYEGKRPVLLGAYSDLPMGRFDQDRPGQGPTADFSPRPGKGLPNCLDQQIPFRLAHILLGPALLTPQNTKDFPNKKTGQFSKPIRPKHPTPALRRGHLVQKLSRLLVDPFGHLPGQSAQTQDCLLYMGVKLPPKKRQQMVPNPIPGKPNVLIGGVQPILLAQIGQILAQFCPGEGQKGADEGNRRA
jgi:hypothetical protein